MMYMCKHKNFNSLQRDIIYLLTKVHIFLARVAHIWAFLN